MTKVLAFIFCIFFGLSCVVPYDKNYIVSEEIFVVEGQITNDSTNNFVKLSLSKPNNNHSPTIYPIKNAQVHLFEDGNKNPVSLIETSSGYFQFPKNFNCKIGSTYHVEINHEGKKYISSAETFKDAKAIENVYYEFAPLGLDHLGQKQDAIKVYIDTKDPANTHDYYSWDWSLYEKKFYCASCEGGLFMQGVDHEIMGSCSNDPNLKEIYDYVCDRPCWAIIKNENINTLKDEFSNGNEIKGRLIATLPIYNLEGALIEVFQSTISKSTYDFLKLVQDQNQNAGSLNDTPPATLAGNVYEDGNILKPIAGYISFKSISKKSFWIDKNKVPLDTKVFGLLNGRKAKLEPSGPDYNRPPTAPCLNGPDRTNIKPKEWKN